MIKIHLSTILGRERMSQIELAKKTGIRPATINAMYNEKIERISLVHLRKICEALGCKAEDLLQYVADEECCKYRGRMEKKRDKEN